MKLKNYLFILLIALLSTTPLLAQYSPCYKAAFAEGQKQFKEGNYDKAKTYFKHAKNCPDPNTKAVDEWIGMCEKKIAEAEHKRKIAEAEKCKATEASYNVNIYNAKGEWYETGLLIESFDNKIFVKINEGRYELLTSDKEEYRYMIVIDGETLYVK